jgi:hypothetical protein
MKPTQPKFKTGDVILALSRTGTLINVRVTKVDYATKTYSFSLSTLMVHMWCALNDNSWKRIDAEFVHYDSDEGAVMRLWTDGDIQIPEVPRPNLMWATMFGIRVTLHPA